MSETIPKPGSAGRQALRSACAVLAIILVFPLLSRPAESTMSRDTIRAAYIYNLAQNIQWPNEAAIKRYRIHLTGDTLGVHAQLAKTAKFEQLHNKPFEVTWTREPKLPGDAHLVFLGEDSAASYPALFQEASGRGVLLISENVANKRIIMINLFETSEQILRFEINKANLLNRNLGVNPDIILLGGSEIDVAKLYQESQAELKKLEEVILRQKQAVAGEQARLQEAEARTREQEAIIAAQKKLVEDEKKRYLTLAARNVEQQAVIDRQKTLAEEERVKHDVLAESVRQRETALKAQEKEIAARRSILTRQDEKIGRQEAILARQSSTIATQQDYLYAMSAAALLSVILAIGSFAGYRMKQRANAALLEQKLLLIRTAADLAVAEEKANSANRAKTAFLSYMSHELRTPLNAILGFSQIMARDPDASPKQKENTAIILRSGEHLLSLIGDILDLAKIEAGKITTASADTDLGALLAELVDMLRVRANAKGLRLYLDQSSSFPRFVRTDPAKLRQIIINLVGNAIKFTEQGEISLKLSVLNAEPDPAMVRLLFEVSDTGPGIPPEDLERLFKPFEQAREKKTTGGTGLGLAISREYVNLLGGAISVDSASGKGSTFRFSIVCARIANGNIPALQSPETHALAIKNAKNYRILTVEDQTENRLLLKNLLTPFGFQYREAADGRTAVDAAREWEPHLILMDRRMPVLDGLQAAREIRKLPLPRQPVIIAVTASAYMEEQREMLEAGCDAFLSKPFRERELLDLISRHLEIGVEYQEVTPPEEAGQFGPGSFSGLPEEQRAALLAAVTDLDTTAVEKLIALIRPDNPALAGQLKRAADRLDYSKILRALKLNGKSG